MIIAPKESALRRKQGPTPKVAITSPALAGPRIRAEWIRTLFRLTALTTRYEPTISIAKLWRAGLSTELIDPASEDEREHHPRNDGAARGQAPTG